MGCHFKVRHIINQCRLTLHQKVENGGHFFPNWWYSEEQSLVAIGVICWQLPTKCALPDGGKQFRIRSERSPLYIRQTLITSKDQSLNPIGENCSLWGSSKRELSSRVTKLANAIWDSTLAKKKKYRSQEAYFQTV